MSHSSCSTEVDCVHVETPNNLDSSGLGFRSADRSSSLLEDEDEAPETKILLCQEGVYMLPAKKQQIIGRISLFKLKSMVFVSWLPNRHSGASSSPRADSQQESAEATPSANLWRYAEHPRPLSHFKAIKIHTPKMMTHHIVLVLKNGLTLPPLHFGQGGVRSLLSVLTKQGIALTTSANDHGTYLINIAEDATQRRSNALELSGILMIPPSQLSNLPSASQGHEGAASSQYGPFLHQIKDGMQRVSQYCRESLTQPARNSSAASPERRHAGWVLRAETGVGQFEFMDRHESDNMAAELKEVCPLPLTEDEWFVFMESGDEMGLRQRIFRAGVEPGIRKEVWQCLLRLHQPGNPLLQGKPPHDLQAKYDQVKAQWATITDPQAARFGTWRERKSRVNKDVHRVDGNRPFFAGQDNANAEKLRRILLTYSMYNFDLGYCQGMSDLASPVLYIMRDEALAFWCFVLLMERMEGNFKSDSTSMKEQLQALQQLMQIVDPELHAFIEEAESQDYLFCYRWLLVHFKREFTFDETLRLWEITWACPLTPHFHIYLCMAVLHLHRDALMCCLPRQDELLSFCILLSGGLDLERTIRCAESLVHAAGSRGSKCLQSLDRKDSAMLAQW